MAVTTDFFSHDGAPRTPHAAVVYGGSVVWRDGIALQLEDSGRVVVRSRPETWDQARTALTGQAAVLVCLEHTIGEKEAAWLEQRSIPVVWFVREIGSGEVDPAGWARLMRVVRVYAETTKLHRSAELSDLVVRAAEQRFVTLSTDWAMQVANAIIRLATTEWMCDCGRRHVPAAIDEPEWGSLTPREREVAQLVATGLPNKLAAQRLSISLGTQRKALERVFRKLGFANRKELIASWVKSHN